MVDSTNDGSRYEDPQYDGSRYDRPGNDRPDNDGPGDDDSRYDDFLIGQVNGTGKTDGRRGGRRARRRDVTYRAGHRPDAASRTLTTLALLSGLAAIAFGAASAAHEIAPAYLDPDGKVPGRSIAVFCAVLIGVTLVLVIAARVTVPRRASHRGVASGGIVAFVFAAMLLALGVVVGVLFPDGLIRPVVRDEAPVNSDDGMRFGIERVTGACTSGWKDVDVSAYPGVDAAAVCTDTRVAYMTFDSGTTADLYRGAVASRIASLLEEHASDARAKGDWRTLSGERWLLFGDEKDMTAMEKEWGGTLATVDTSQASGDKGDAS